MILVLYFVAERFNKLHPQITASLFAIKIFFVNLIIFIVGLRPMMPGIAEIVISDLNFLFSNLKKLKILVSDFLNFFLLF